LAMEGIGKMTQHIMPNHPKIKGACP